LPPLAVTDVVPLKSFTTEDTEDTEKAAGDGVETTDPDFLSRSVSSVTSVVDLGVPRKRDGGPRRSEDRAGPGRPDVDAGLGRIRARGEQPAARGHLAAPCRSRYRGLILRDGVIEALAATGQCRPWRPVYPPRRSVHPARSPP